MRENVPGTHIKMTPDSMEFLLKWFKYLGVNPKGQNSKYPIFSLLHLILTLGYHVAGYIIHVCTGDDRIENLVITFIMVSAIHTTILRAIHTMLNVEKYYEIWQKFRRCVEENSNETSNGDKKKNKEIMIRAADGRVLFFLKFLGLNLIILLLLFIWKDVFYAVGYLISDPPRVVLGNQLSIHTYSVFNLSEPLGYFIESLHSSYCSAYLTMLYVCKYESLFLFSYFLVTLHTLWKKVFLFWKVFCPIEINKIYFMREEKLL